MRSQSHRDPTISDKVTVVYSSTLPKNWFHPWSRPDNGSAGTLNPNQAVLTCLPLSLHSLSKCYNRGVRWPRRTPKRRKNVEKTFSGGCQIFILGHPRIPPACSRTSPRPLYASPLALPLASSPCLAPFFLNPNFFLSDLVHLEVLISGKCWISCYGFDLLL